MIANNLMINVRLNYEREKLISENSKKKKQQFLKKSLLDYSFLSLSSKSIINTIIKPPIVDKIIANNMVIIQVYMS